MDGQGARGVAEIQGRRGIGLGREKCEVVIAIYVIFQICVFVLTLSLTIKDFFTMAKIVSAKYRSC